MFRRALFGVLYGGFLLWQNRWFSDPLTEAEVDDYLDRADRGASKALTEEERANFRNFLVADDGKPFYMVNLMEYRKEAVYEDGLFPDVKTGAEANELYGKAVIKELLKRGSYPVFLSKKIGNFLNAGAETDFFEEVGIVRYRSRRDLLEMITSADFVSAEPHKWASMKNTVVVPSRKVILLDPSVIVPLILLILFGRRN